LAFRLGRQDGGNAKTHRAAIVESPCFIRSGGDWQANGGKCKRPHDGDRPPRSAPGKLVVTSVHCTALTPRHFDSHFFPF
jgi:hypothetical protein